MPCSDVWRFISVTNISSTTSVSRVLEVVFEPFCLQIHWFKNLKILSFQLSLFFQFGSILIFVPLNRNLDSHRPAKHTGHIRIDWFFDFAFFCTLIDWFIKLRSQLIFCSIFTFLTASFLLATPQFEFLCIWRMNCFERGHAHSHKDIDPFLHVEYWVGHKKACRVTSGTTGPNWSPNFFNPFPHPLWSKTFRPWKIC